ncbi:MAG: DUF4184 family protein [Acidobacteriia bacterium]|nr:DUF4184 family protein [Terriglobia bacterium]
MPLTFSHPAAVLPLRRWRLVFSALVVGSMAPDFEYFFALVRSVSHSFPGVITFTFPLALAVLIIFHELVKWPVISLLPRGMQARMVGPARRFRWWPPSRLLLVMVSLAIGIATHLFWDAFTHPDGWAVIHWPTLRSAVIVFPHRRVPFHLLLQNSGTALGLLAVALSFARWYRHAPQDDVAPHPQFSPAIKWAILSAMVATAVVLGLVNGADWYGSLLQADSQRTRFVFGSMIAAITVGFIELFGFGLIWRAFLARDTAGAAAQAGRPS